MSLNFPISANIGDIYTSGNISYEFNGVKWVPVNRTDYVVQASDVTTTANSLVIDMSVDGIQIVTLSEEATVSFTGADSSDQYKRALVELTMNTDPSYEVLEPWSIASAVYTSDNFPIGTEDGNHYGITFKPDGTKMYTVAGNNRKVFEYDLSTPWAISSASYSNNSFSVNDPAGGTGAPVAVRFKPDGTIMYTILLNVPNRIFQYNLTTPWSVSSAVYSNIFKDYSAQDALGWGLDFKPDGTKMYVIGDTNNSVYEYPLSTPWLISSAGTPLTFSVADQEVSPCNLEFKPDGSRMYVMGSINRIIFEYELSTPWLISSAKYSGNSVLIPAAQDTAPKAFAFKPDGAKMYMTGTTTDSVYEYDIIGSVQLSSLQWPETMEWDGGYAPDLPNTLETVTIEIESRTDYRGTTYTGLIVGRNF